MLEKATEGKGQGEEGHKAVEREGGADGVKFCKDVMGFDLHPKSSGFEQKG